MFLPRLGAFWGAMEGGVRVVADGGGMASARRLHASVAAKA